MEQTQGRGLDVSWVRGYKNKNPGDGWEGLEFNRQARQTGIQAWKINAHDILKETGQMDLIRFSCGLEERHGSCSVGVWYSTSSWAAGVGSA